jgi:hypothetical protein
VARPVRKPTTRAKVLLKKRPKEIEPNCLLLHEDLGRRYVENAKERTERDPWDSFLYGLVLTATPNAEYHNEALEGLKGLAPSPETMNERCFASGTHLTTADDLPAANRFYKAAQIKTSLCENSQPKTEFIEVDDKSGVMTRVPVRFNWSHMKKAMQSCNRPAVRDHYYFQRSKGSDMLMLESGCETPVVDIHMLRHVYKDILPKKWDEVEVTRQLKGMQGRPIDYELTKQEIIKEAQTCGVPADIYHVSVWLERRFGEDHDAAEAYLNELIDAIPREKE